MALKVPQLLARLDTTKAEEGFPRFHQVFAKCEFIGIADPRSIPTASGDRTVFAFQWRLLEPLTDVSGRTMAKGRTITHDIMVDPEDDQSVNSLNVAKRHIIMAIRGIESNDPEAQERLEFEDEDEGGEAILYFTTSPKKDEPDDLSQGYQRISYYTEKGAKKRRERLEAKSKAAEKTEDSPAPAAARGRRGKKN